MGERNMFDGHLAPLTWTRRALGVSLLFGGSMDSLAKSISFPTARSVRFDGLTFPVSAWGPAGGRPILLLHGFPQEPATWTPVAEALVQNGLQSFAPYQRGYLSSTRPKAPAGYSFERFVADVLAIADSLGLKEFDVAGVGIGGAQAWMLAAHHPGRVRSLTSLRFPHPAAFARGIQFDPDQQGKWRRLQEQFGTGGPDERAMRLLANNGAGLRKFLTEVGLVEPYLSRYAERLTEPATLAGALSWEHSISLEEFARVPEVTCPTLLIWSEGPALARTTVETTRQYVRAPFTDVVISGVGHFILETSPDAVIAPLRRHLEST
ncbi:MAG TPA: alpha/beta hydrolase [Steroidobacteraceae bacterium]|nr:alpha/beta hydrolase [Steroidobacteraceae bacterium]